MKSSEIELSQLLEISNLCKEAQTFVKHSPESEAKQEFLNKVANVDALVCDLLLKAR